MKIMTTRSAIMSIFVLIAVATVETLACERAWVKYRNSPVCLDQFEYGDTSRSSWIRGAWYDDDHDYMVINLDGIKYHYCRFPRSAWSGLLNAPSHGRYYHQSIKGKYDCRLGGVPDYRTD